MNLSLHGFLPLFHKEIIRFYKVSFQTILAPVISALLYLSIFGHVLDGKMDLSHGIEYAAFLVPGLMMMSMLQNAFANSASSLIQSKITGNIIFILIPPISNFAFFLSYTLAAVVRGLCVGTGIWLATLPFTHAGIQHPFWLLAFAICGCATLGVIGLIAGIWAEKFDQLAAFQNFFIMPATMLSGVFYSVQSLSPFWQWVAHLNPFFYMIDGFRYGFFGKSDVLPWFSLGINLAMLLCTSLVALFLLKKGYKLKH